jgi:hypothetical protein
MLSDGRVQQAGLCPKWARTALRRPAIGYGSQRARHASMAKPGHCHLPLRLASADRSHCMPIPAQATSLIASTAARGAAPACAADGPSLRRTEEQLAAELE